MRAANVYTGNWPRSQGSSVSIVSDYGLDDRAIWVPSPEKAKDFSSNLCVQTGSGAHAASYAIGIGGNFPGGKARPGHDAEYSPPSSVVVKNEQELHLLSPKAPPRRLVGLLQLYATGPPYNSSWYSGPI
jgi:hypothetical protein